MGSRCSNLRVRDLAEVELDDLVGAVEVAVVVGDHDDGLSAPSEPRKDLGVEDLAEPRLLVGRPLVEQIDRPVFQQRGQQREPFALPLRQRNRRQPSVVHGDLVRKL